MAAQAMISDGQMRIGQDCRLKRELPRPHWAKRQHKLPQRMQVDSPSPMKRDSSRQLVTARDSS